jgi:PKD repeat protein
MCINDLRELTTRAASALLVVVVAAACTLENQERPALSGPSELGLAISMTASPDQLPRDGSSQSVVTLTARDPQGRPVAGQRLTLSLPVNSPSGAALSATDVVTNAGGQVVFTVNAPIAGSLGNITIYAVPFGTDANNNSIRTIAIDALPQNSTVPVPSFIFTPNGPEVGQLVTFDASGTQDEGRPCTDQCTFAWDFGTEGTATGRIVTHTFQAGGSIVVTLKVTDSANTVGTSQRTISIVAPGPATVAFSVSPVSPIAGQTATFTSLTTPAVNHRIVSFVWTWGDGAASTTTASSIQHVYDQAKTYPVTLTVTDDLGQSATVTNAVVVGSGLTARLTQSPAGTLAVGQTVFFDASTSSSNTGTAITNYLFDFGDGTSQASSFPTAKHEYGATGTYTVKLTITDDRGRTASTTTVGAGNGAGNVTVQ